jgi:hypothetical protein
MAHQIKGIEMFFQGKKQFESSCLEKSYGFVC